MGSTLPYHPFSGSTIVNQVANGALAGGMVMHIFAAILAFFSSFFLIRYKLAVAKREERRVEVSSREKQEPDPDLELGTRSRARSRGTQEAQAQAASPDTPESAMTDPGIPAIFSSNPHVEQVGPFKRGQPPTHLLEHCHTLCMWLAAGGFVLALVGVGCFAWSRLARSGSIFASGCLLVCCVSSLVAFFWPASSAHSEKGSAQFK